MSEEIKHGSLQDLETGVHVEILEMANQEAWRYAFNAVDWDLSLSSSTSGMYGKWKVRISPTTTVKDVTLFSLTPHGTGGDLAQAFQDFTRKMKEFNDKYGFEI